MLSPSSSPAGGAKYQKSCQQWRLFFDPMISSLSVNHWRKHCFRLVRAQQAEPIIRKLQRCSFFYTRKKNIDNVPTNNQLSNSQYSSLKTATVAAAEHRCRF